MEPHLIIDPTIDKNLHVWYAYKHPPTRKRWVQEMLVTEGPYCKLCDYLMDIEASSDDTSRPWRVTFDHIIPKSKQGSHDRSNLQLTHYRCNMKRSNNDSLTPDQLKGITTAIPKHLRITKPILKGD